MARWLIVNSTHHASQGGVGGYVDRVIRAGAEHGHAIELMTRPSDHLPPAHRLHLVETADMRPTFEARIAPLRRLDLIRPYRYGLWALAAARRLAASDALADRYDAIEFMDCRGEGVVAMSSPRVQARWADTPMLIGAHTPMWVEEEMNEADLSRFGRAVYHAWEREAIERANGVFSPSRTLLDQMSAKRKGHIAYPMSLPRLAPPLTLQQRDAPAILVAATLQPRKGVVEWIDSLNIVLRDHPRAKARLIGPDTQSAPVSGGSMWAFVESRIHPAVKSRVRWFDLTSPDRLATLMREATLIVVPSRFECFSLVAADGLGYGRPTLLSDAVGVASLAPSAPTFPAGDVDALAAAQLDVLARLDEAADRALTARTELVAACDPASVFEERLAFAGERHAAVEASAPRTEKADGLDLIDAFDLLLRGIEQAERTLRPS